MARHLSLLGALLCLACTSIQPYSSLATVQTDRDTAFNCATRTLNSLGYTVKDANKEAGFVQGERQRPPRFLEMEVWFDQLTVSLFTEAANELKVRAVGTTVSGNVIAEPSEALKKDVENLAAACGLK